MATTDSGTLDLLKQFYKVTDISKLLDETISAEELKYDLQDPWDPYKLELDSAIDYEIDYARSKLNDEFGPDAEYYFDSEAWTLLNKRLHEHDDIFFSAEQVYNFIRHQMLNRISYLSEI